MAKIAEINEELFNEWLSECDLPDDSEQLGSLLNTNKEIEMYFYKHLEFLGDQ